MSVISDIFAGGAEGIFTGIRSLIGAFKADPTVSAQLAAEVARAEMDLDAKLAAADAAQVAAVNATMQAEAKSEHWIQYAWRPTIGFTFAGILVNNYILLPYFGPLGIVSIPVPETVWLAMLGVLGAAAYTRGQEKVARITNGK